MPRTAAPPASPAQRIHQRLSILRVLAGTGAQFGYLLVPLLAFKLTGSWGVLGVALLMDGVARALAQCFGALLLSRQGPAKVHVLAEGLRVLGLGGMLLCAAGAVSASWVVVFAACSQLAISLTLTLYAYVVSAYYPTAEQASAHHQQGYLEQVGCLTALLAGLLAPSPLVLAALAAVSQGATASLLLSWLRALYPKKQQGVELGNPLRQLWADASACARRPLARYVLGSSLFFTAVMAGFSVPVFVLAREGISVESSGQWLSAILLAKTVLSVGALRVTRNWAASPRRAHWRVRIGAGLAISGALAMLPSGGPLLVALALLSVGLGAALAVPHLRHVRQVLIDRWVPKDSRVGALGVLAAADALGFVGAGTLLLLVPNLGMLLSAAAAAGLAGLALLEKPSLHGRALP